MLDRLRLGVVNFRASWGNKKENIRRMTLHIQEAAKEACDFLIFPELCTNGYADEPLNCGERIHLALAEPYDGATAQYFSALAQQYKMYIVYGMSESISDNPTKAYNTAITVTPEGKILPYRKIHPVEGEWCQSGDRPLLLDTPWGVFGVSVCYDTYSIPELQRYYAAKGARLIINPTASARGYDQRTGDIKGWHWYYEARLETIADRDGLWVASANLLGTDGTQRSDGSYPFVFPGGSVAIAPQAEGDRFVSQLIGNTRNAEEGVAVGEMDLTKASRMLFLGESFRPTLYEKWYQQLADDYAPAPRPKEDIVIAVSNFSTRWGDKEANLEQMEKEIHIAAQKGANLLLFPEMALTGYWYRRPQRGQKCMQQRLAEAIPGPSTKRIADLAKLYGIYIVFGMPEKDGATIYNSAAILKPDGSIEKYRKIHLIGDEWRWCKPGDTPYLLDTPYGRIGISICYDTYYIPELTRYYGGMGARILLNPTASFRGADKGRWQHYYRTRLESTADQNGLLIASSNITGQDGLPQGATPFPGGSVVLGATWTEGVYYVGAVEDASAGIFVSPPIELPQKGFNIIGFRPSLYRELYGELADLKRQKTYCTANR